VALPWARAARPQRRGQLTAAAGEPGPLPEDRTVWAGHREVGFVGRPTARASIAYRLARLVASLALRGAFGFRIEVEGREHLPRTADGRPAGGWIAACLPHRTWVDPFAVLLALPLEPRLVFFGDGRAMFRSVWRSFWVHRIGGLIPIWVRRYSPGVEREDVMATYVDAVRAALGAGAILALMPETGPPVPVDQARPLGRGVAYFGLRTGAPIVPIVLGGTDVLFRGRRIIVRILPPLTAPELAGLAPAAEPPEPWSRDERLAARRLTDALHARTTADVAAVHRLAAPPAGARRRWLWLTHLWR
jgi:1-acyl-sn-glycerol-3-phosphate acyltransferase